MDKQENRTDSNSESNKEVNPEEKSEDEKAELQDQKKSIGQASPTNESESSATPDSLTEPDYDLSSIMKKR